MPIRFPAKGGQPLLAALLIFIAAPLLFASRAQAHAIAGDRMFPATMAVDDPGVGDEADVTFGHIRVPGDNGDQNINSWNFEYDKLITPSLAFSVNGSYSMQNNPATNGWDNFGVGLKYRLYTNPEHEFMTSVGVNATLGNTGSQAVASNSTTLSPTLYVGKGMGDLPDSLAYLRPFAVTAETGPSISLGSDPNAFNYGFTVQYSLPYLQQNVHDFHLPHLLANMIPVVEVPLSRSQGQTTGTINPGVIWVGRYGQIGVEAQLPINHASGTRVGVLVQFHLYLDDVAPHSLGAPLFN